jgi:hypothetical protein
VGVRGLVRAAVGAAVAVSVAGSGWAPALAASPDPSPSPSAVAVPALPPHTFAVPDQETSDAIAAAAVTTDSGCGAASTTPVKDGARIVVRIKPAKAFTVGKISASSWRKPPVADPAWRLEFYGFMWLPSLAQRAADDGQKKALAVLVDQMVQFHRQNPDPRRNERGWDEGAAMRRLLAENCLFSLTHSKRLLSGMKADANVQLGARYYGPPYQPVHNHGLMANLALLKAGTLVGNSSWKAVAARRMRAESVKAFSKQGTSYEQSSQYQRVNVSLWNQAARALRQLKPGDPAAATITQVTAKGMRIFAWLTEPDRKIVLIGDSDEGAGATRSKATERILRDNQAGLGVGRWSWSDPRTTYYTVRYGPAIHAHGQQDRGGVTWSALGTRVLVGPGRYTYHAASGYYGYAKGPASHNVAYPTKGRLTNKRTVTVTRVSATSTRHGWQLKDGLFGPAHARSVLVDAKKHRLTVTDVFPRTTSFVQKWHLDVSWRLSSVSNRGRTAVFTRSGGHRLVLTTGGTITVRRGSTRPVAGWYFPSFGHRASNDEITVSARGTTTTTFTIS